MIQAFFFDLQQVNGDRGRPDDVEPFAAKKVVVLGAGMMGAAIAYVCAQGRHRGGAQGRRRWRPPTRGKGYSEKLVAKGVERGRTTQEKGDALLGAHHPDRRRRPTPPARTSSSRRCSRTRRSRRRCSPRSSRTWRRTRCSAPTPRRCRSPSWPRASRRPADFIGLHFFSPVDKMPLLEIIRGEKTSEETLYRALDVAKQINKTPIVVNDCRGFFTSRVIGTFINEGIAMLAEGVPAPTIEQASSQAGYPAPGAAADRRAQPQADAQDPQRRQGGRRRVLQRLGRRTRPSGSSTGCSTRSSRPGKLEGEGFYEYADGKRTAPVAGAARRLPGRRGSVGHLAEGPRGADAVHRDASRR